MAAATTEIITYGHLVFLNLDDCTTTGFAKTAAVVGFKMRGSIPIDYPNNDQKTSDDWGSRIITVIKATEWTPEIMKLPMSADSRPFHQQILYCNKCYHALNIKRCVPCNKQYLGGNSYAFMPHIPLPEQLRP